MWFHHSGRSSLLFSASCLVVISSFFFLPILSLFCYCCQQNPLSNSIKDPQVFSIRIFNFKTLFIFSHSVISKCFQKHPQPQQLSSTRYMSRITFLFRNKVSEGRVNQWIHYTVSVKLRVRSWKFQSIQKHVLNCAILELEGIIKIGGFAKSSKILVVKFV